MNEKIGRFGEALARKAAWLLPRKIVYWCAIRVWAHATTGPYGNTEAPAVTCSTAIERWA